MPAHYILRDRKVVKVSRQEHMRWFASETREQYRTRRLVGRDDIGGSIVSTVFTDLDHAYGEGPPLLFETRVLSGPLQDETEHWATWEQAEAAHKAMCERVRNAT